MKNTILFMLKVTAALFAWVGAVQAQSSQLTSYIYNVRPYPGVYYDPSQSGTGFTVDTLRVGDRDFVFSSYYHYGSNGQPDWMNFGAYLVPFTKSEYLGHGMPAVIRSQWNRSTGGQCFDCAYTAPTTTTPPWGEREVQVLSGKHLKMPASGNAADRNLRLAKTIVNGKSDMQALLDKGAVWAVEWNKPSSFSTPRKTGWLYFRKRPTDRKLTFGANIGNQQEPDWLKVADKNSPDQYELVSAFSFDQYHALPEATKAWVGSYGLPSELGEENLVDYEDDDGTLIIDASNGRARHYLRCRSNVAYCPNWNARTNVTIRGISDVFDGGPDLEGNERIIVRTLSFSNFPQNTGWFSEIQLTRVPNSIARAIAPHLPTGIAQ